MSYQVTARKWRPQKFDDVVGQHTVTRTLRNALGSGRLAQAIFMMATTELDKIPETVLSRSQVYEFRTISSKSIAGQLRKIVDAEGIDVGEDALQLIARDADGSMRDAQSKLDQVIAFTGKTIAIEDVSAVLGLVGRDLLLDTMTAVADENAPAAFEIAARAVELGYDLRAVCRELARMTRDLLVLSVDPSRANDPEIAAETERDRLLGLTKKFSREDLLRAFDLLSKAESDIRSASQPRYHLEMALLRWIHLRKLVSIEDLIAGNSSAPARGGPERPALRTPEGPSAAAPVRRATLSGSPALPVAPAPVKTAPPGPPSPNASFKDAFLAEVRKNKAAFYNMVVAQARTIDVTGDRIVFTFSANQRALKEQVEQNKTWLEQMALQAGRKVTVTATQDGAASPEPRVAAQANPESQIPNPDTDRKAALKKQALADSGVQAMLEVFPAEIRDVEEM